MEEKNKSYNHNIFLNSVFFVLGFSLIFSILGVLLQTILSQASHTVMIWLGRIGGLIIIFFGLFTLGLIKPWFLLREHKFKVKKTGSNYLTSFLFGAAFAVGWTPCVSAALGAILTLASINPSSAFFLLLFYTLGLGIPFLIVGLFADKAAKVIRSSGKWLSYVQYLFGVILIIIGILIFTGQLNRIANSPILTETISALHINFNVGEGINSLNLINVTIAFIAGLASFLSPCVLPLLPGFLSYLASSTNKENENK